MWQNLNSYWIKDDQVFVPINIIKLQTFQSAACKVFNNILLKDRKHSGFI